MNRFVCLCAILCLPLSGRDFLHPIEPVHISGSFAEYRKYGRYHHGLDYKTFNRLAVPVRMPADGTLERMQISDLGYGNALWVRSGADLFTFAHLQDFACGTMELEHFSQAYLLLTGQKTLSMHLPGLFRYKQGECLARSGESGTGAPHLHFEILRDGSYINPLAEPGLEIEDRTHPIFQNLYFEGKAVKKAAVQSCGPGCYTLPEKFSIPGAGKLLIGLYDTMAARNRNGIYSLRLETANRMLFERKLSRIRPEEFARAGEVYHVARTAIGQEYVYLLYGSTTPQVEPGAEYSVSACDHSGNCSRMTFHTVAGPVEREQGGFTTLSAGQVLRCSTDNAWMSLAATDRSLFGDAVLNFQPALVEDLPMTGPMFARSGSGFRLQTRDTFFRDGLQGEAVFPVAEKAALYYYDEALAAWRLLARPYKTDATRAYYNFIFRAEGFLSQLSDMAPPETLPSFLWQRPDLPGRIVRELALRDQGSGINEASIQVTLDGLPLNAQYIADRYVLRLEIAPQIIHPEGSLLAVQFSDHAGNRSGVYTEILENEIQQ
ncbi:MAG: M23 family metallopeptidase [Spirochaetales bacterium]|nr:M23 family metallopeptidase [Spirochaetales bacterium]